jgi:hypothetical protein
MLTRVGRSAGRSPVARPFLGPVGALAAHRQRSVRHLAGSARRSGFSLASFLACGAVSRGGMRRRPETLSSTGQPPQVRPAAKAAESTVAATTAREISRAICHLLFRLSRERLSAGEEGEIGVPETTTSILSSPEA